METLLYIVTAVITVLFAVYIYISWHEKAGLAEDSGYRVASSFITCSYFLFYLLISWSPSFFIRLDLISMLLFNTLTLLSFFAIFVGNTIQRVKTKSILIPVLVIFNTLNVIILIILFYLRSNPHLLILISIRINNALAIDIFSLQWLSWDAAGQDEILYSLISKILIALLSYIPVSIIRYLSAKHYRKRLKLQLEVLDRRVKKLEKDFFDHSNF